MRQQAVILKKIPIREYDELLVCYTKDEGKQIYQAKSIQLPTSKQAGHLEVLNLVDFSLVHKNSHPIFTSAYCLNAFPRLKSSLPAMSAAFFLLECFDKLVFESEADLQLWEFLNQQLNYYETFADTITASSNNVKIWSKVFSFTRQNLLKILGYDPSTSIEYIAQSQFKSLQFARKVLE